MRVFRGYGYPLGRLTHRIIELFAKKALSSQKFIQNLSSTDAGGVSQIFRQGIQHILNQEFQNGKMTGWPTDQMERIGRCLENVNEEISERFIQLQEGSDARTALKKLFLALEWSFKQVIVVEAEGGSLAVELGGRLDWLSVDPFNNTITLWDFKTSPSSNFERDLPQITLYSIVVEEIFNVPVNAALMYISEEGIERKVVSHQTIQRLKPGVLKSLVLMGRWVSGASEVPYTIYEDMCHDCIVAKHCVNRFGTNPHLDKLGRVPEEPEDDGEENLLVEEYEPSSEEGIAPDYGLIEPMKIQPSGRDSMEEEVVDQTTLSPAILGSKLNDGTDLEIHPLVLIRHGVILGASGSGKTVLGKVLIEEMLLKGFSCVLIDPQGDLCSLVLPDSEVGRKIRDQTQVRIYTPNSNKGENLTINPLQPPAPELLEDEEYLRTVLDSTATTLLEIAGYSSKKLLAEKALLESILMEDWKVGRNHNMQSLAQRVGETTSIRSVTSGVEVDVEDLISSRKLGELGKNLMKLAIGTEGSFFTQESQFELEELVNSPPQLHIINLASVGTDQTKRQMVVSWILRLIYDWLLRNPQKVQDQIRFFLYIDEVADFLPPHPYNPPSKKMLMLLMRQARKYGCSCLIATQSPATIDYKAIDNVGTLMIGRIPSQQSIKKIEAFLEPYGQRAQQLVRKVKTVEPGQFLMIGGGQTTPQMFKTRWLYTKHQTLSLDDIEKLKRD